MKTLYFSLVLTAAIVIGVVNNSAYAAAPIDKADWYLQATLRDANGEIIEVVDDFTNTQSQCKELEESYRQRGYELTQRCHRGPNSG